MPRYDKDTKTMRIFRDCPINHYECIGDRCAWWLDTAKNCTITMIGYWMNENGNYEFNKRDENL
jgi:hypothetical protein